MGRQTFLWLFLGVVLLAGIVVWQRGREQLEDLGLTDVELFEGVDVACVNALVVDHLERGLQLRLERDARGLWYITDPIVYPADPAVVGLLLETVAGTRALLVPEAERDAAQLGFDPPRALFIAEEQRDGTRLRHELELGYLDLDGKLLNVRKDGRYLRILRKLDTTLLRGVNEFRSQRVLQVPGAAITALNRWGSVQEDLDTPPRDLRLNAVLDVDTWRSLVPYAAALDALDFGVLLFGAGGLRVDRFVDDAPTELASYGLEQPLLSIELITTGDARELLHFGRVRGDWYAQRDGLPHVFGIAAEDMLRVLIPFDELVESRVLRVAREEVDAIVLESPAGELRLAREGEGWTVSERATGADRSAPFPAESARVEELLGALDALELGELRLDEPFPADAPARGVRVDAAGAQHGGRIGPMVVDAAGEPACWFQRFGDEIASLAPAVLLELTDARADSYRSLEVAMTTEVQVLALELERGAERLRFVRDGRGRWTREGASDEARELLPALDALLFLRASEHAGELGPADLADPIAVRFELRDGAAPVDFRVGLAPASGEGAFVERFGALARLKAADLHARLASLFGN